MMSSRHIVTKDLSSKIYNKKDAMVPWILDYLAYEVAPYHKPK